jgi:hypothetical protein
MAKTVRSDKWFVRVDGEIEFLRSKCKELSNSIDVINMLGTYHKGEKKENPHVHFVITLSSSPQKQQFGTNRIRSLFNITKKSDYSVTVWDGIIANEGAGSYLFHEDNAPIIVCKSISEEDIASARKANDAVKKVVAINKEKAEHKLVDKALTKFRDEENVSKQDIIFFMLKCISKGENYYPNEYKLKAFVEEVEIKLCKDDNDLENWALRFERRMWRD